MKKYLLILISTLCCFLSYAQPVVQRANSNFTQQDDRLKVLKNLSIPYGSDTTLNSGLPTIGSLFYKTADSTLYTYTGHNWIKVKGAASTGGGGSHGNHTGPVTSVGLATSMARVVPLNSGTDPGWQGVYNAIDLSPYSSIAGQNNAYGTTRWYSNNYISSVGTSKKRVAGRSSYIALSSNGDLTYTTAPYGAVGATNSFTTRFSVDSMGNGGFGGNISVGSASATSAINLNNVAALTGSIIAVGYSKTGTIQSDVTTEAVGYRSSIGTASSSFTLTDLNHFKVSSQAVGSGSVITNQTGFLVNSSLTAATNNYGFRGQVASGSNRYNLYMDGTADNYLAGNLKLNTLTASQLVATDASKNLVSITALPSTTTATTQTASDNSTKVATTAYVDAAVSSGGATSGTYMPTITNGGNVNSSLAQLTHWIRVANEVHWTGNFFINPTVAGGVATYVHLSLPVASNFATGVELFGVTNTQYTLGTMSVGTSGVDTALDNMTITVPSLIADPGAQSVQFSVTYTVVP